MTLDEYEKLEPLFTLWAECQHRYSEMTWGCVVCGCPMRLIAADRDLPFEIDRCKRERETMRKAEALDTQASRG